MECHGTFVPPVKIFYSRFSEGELVCCWPSARKMCLRPWYIWEKYTLTFVVSVVYSAGMSSKGPTLLRLYVIKKKKKICEKISPLFKYNSNLYKKSAMITRLLPIPLLPHHQIWILEHLLNCAALLWVGMCYMLANITKLIKL